MLDSRDVHCKWVPDVPGGEIIRDPGLGVFCNKAMDMVVEKTPEISQAQNIQKIQSAMSELNKVGFTGIHDAGMKMDVAETFAE
jgi:predicted amidohydrolase YtcJ